MEAPQEVVRSVEGPASTRALPVLSDNVRLSLVIAVLIVAAVSACTVATAGTPEAASPTTSASGGPSNPGEDLPSDGVPKVENPLDVSHFEEHPCDALTPEDAKELNIPAVGDQSDNGAGQSCDWVNRKTRGSLRASFFSETGRGLSGVYEEAKGSGWPLFQRIDDIEGHPAVAFNISQAKPIYDCAVAIGLTDRLSFTTTAMLSDANAGKTNPCDAAAQAAGMLLRTMEAA